MLAVGPDTLHVILMIVAGRIGFFAALWLYAFFFTSSKNAEDSFSKAAEYPLNGHPFGFFKIMVWLVLAMKIGVIACLGLDALVDYFSPTR